MIDYRPDENEPVEGVTMFSAIRTTALAAAAVLAVLGGTGSAQAVPSVCDAIAGNLVTNCGFETDDFTGWMVTHAATNSSVGVSNGDENSGSFGAFFGAVGPSEDMISQSIATIAGDAYTVSFFLDSQGRSLGPNQFTALFGGTTLLSLTNTGGFDYEAFTDAVMATGSSTTLSFATFNLPDFFLLDDVSVVPTSVTPVPEPDALALLAVGLAGLGVVLCTRRA